MPANLENSAVAIGLEKVSFHSNPKERQCHCTTALISHASKVMLKILQVRLQQYMTQELPHVQAGFRKGRRTRDQIANIHWIMEKEESSRKTLISALLTMPKPLTVWITINWGKFWKRWEYQTTWPASWEICMQFKKQQLEVDMSPSLFNLHAERIMWNVNEAQLEWRLPGEISIISDMQMIPPLWQKVKN